MNLDILMWCNGYSLINKTEFDHLLLYECTHTALLCYNWDIAEWLWHLLPYEQREWIIMVTTKRKDCTVMRMVQKLQKDKKN